ncbi:putative quinol monooxygenase [Bacillus sp. Marseille-Q1617]|uniref:putative quinol monooxygenase n=1 Tax=Bacillus sp. Marseille-Q1617 TaxID=2736887 RepID=UPI0015894B53|nr:putative quinol monooxygenase [Bacillus sp. Marseille-Q1617]
MIIIHAHFQIIPEKEGAFLEEMQSLVAASRGEDGNVSYDLMKSTETDHTYTMVEIWKDQAAVEAHNTSSHFVSFAGRAPEYMAAPIDVQIFEGNKVER